MKSILEDDSKNNSFIHPHHFTILLVVALLAKKGVCTIAEKAEFASRNIHPKGMMFDQVFWWL
jgi:hypothetical protein